MAEDPRKTSDEEERVQKALGSLNKLFAGRKTAPAEEAKPAAGAPPKKREGILGELVEAMKAGAGTFNVPPPGYDLLDGARVGRVIELGQEGEVVTALQRALRLAGVKVEETGVFDHELVAAVKNFQRESALRPDGIVGSETLRALDRALRLPDRDPEEDKPDDGLAPSGLPRSGNEFIDRIAPGAVRGMKETGVPASVLIAQGVLESGWGSSDLAARYQNLFWTQGEGAEGTVYLKLEGDEDETAYRVYKDPGDSVADHARQIAGAERFRGAMSQRGFPEGFAKALGDKYSQDPNYGMTLIRVMRQFNLGVYDRIAAGGG